MVISSPLRFAIAPPTAYRTMLRWFGIAQADVVRILYRVLQKTLYVAVVGPEIRYPVRIGDEFIRWRDHVHQIRQRPLKNREEIGVKRQLKDSRRFRF